MFRTTFDAKKRQWNGAKTKSFFSPEANLGSEILKLLQENGPKVAQICVKTRSHTTFNDLYVLTICAAKTLQNLGYKKGDLIWLFTNNSADITPLVYAALCLGCVIAAESTAHGCVEIHHTLNYLKPRVIFCDLEYYAMLKECVFDLKINADFFIVGDQTDDTLSIKYFFRQINIDTQFVSAEINVCDVAILVSTSGSMGYPKSVPLTHANILDKMRKHSAFIGAGDIMLGYTNLDCISGVRFLIGGTLNSAIRIVNQGKFMPEHFFKLVEEFQVNFTSLSMSFVHQLLNHPQIETVNLSSIKIFRCSGAKVPFNFIQKMNYYLRGGQFSHSFGMTEQVGVVAINLYHSKNNCVGQLIDDCTAKIVNEQGDRLGLNETGELCLKDPFMFEGYLGVDGCAHQYFDFEGFFKTGDLAYFDENSDLFLIDRIREQFTSFGEHVNPTEIQEFLNRINGVKESYVMPVLDSKCNLLPAAIIVKMTNSNCTEQSICKNVSDTLANHKRLRGGVYFVDSIPITSSGKVDQRLVVKIAEELYYKKMNTDDTNNNLLTYN